jgi:FKBP-type peptidyl-prolyl cis-trans isomerase 2
MATAQIGDTVLVHYTGKLDDGSVFDSSQEREPLRVTLGQSAIIPGFQDALVGMEPGSSKTATLPPEAAYGERRNEMVVDIDRDKFPSEFQLQVGKELQLQTKDGQPVPARVAAVKDTAVTVDANHPLAGRELTFDIELLDIVADK